LKKNDILTVDIIDINHLGLGVAKLDGAVIFVQGGVTKDKLKIKKLDKRVAVFAVCSTKKLGVDNMLFDVARLCAKEVTVIESNCCGFAGDRGFTFPQLNTHGLRMLRSQVEGTLVDGTKTSPCVEGYATSRTCEIGLSRNSGITFKSILYLLDEASE
jgi:D-lactate dehydrogenase